jgi:glycosyltransferase involved in cell wall biosynthesis
VNKPSTQQLGPLTVGLNLLYLRPGQDGGSELYVREILQRLLLHQTKPRFRVYCFEDVAATLGVHDSLEVVAFSGKYSVGRRFVAENFRINADLHRRPLDVLFSPINYAIPLLTRRVPQVVTVHDLQHRWLRQNFSLAKWWARELLFRTTSRRAAAVICVSEFTAKDMHNTYGTAACKLHAIPHGVEVDVPTAHQRAEVRNLYGLRGPFVIYPAMWAPHKNHETLRAAMAQLVDVTDVTLVLTGAPPPVPIHDPQIRHLGPVPRAHLMALIAEAQGLVFPSRFEGFGLPILEAMALGTPVAATREGSLAEVCGSAAITVLPDNVSGWAEVIRYFGENRTSAVDLVAEGLANVKRFSWQRSAEETVALLHDIAGR